jgi:predicted Zn-dependent protease
VAAVDELLETFAVTPSLEEAEHALDSIARAEYPPDLPLGDLYDALAEAAAESDDFARAVRTQRRALELGCSWQELGREMLAWYLLKNGQYEEGEAIFRELRAERPTDAMLVLMLAAARHAAGLETAALRAHDEALAVARACDPELVDQVRVERSHLRQELGLDAAGTA